MGETNQPGTTAQPSTALGIYDPLSAAIADKAGADYLWLSSYSFAASQGLPDVGAISLPLQESVVSRIRMASSRPIIVDLDNASRSRKHCELLADKLLQLGVEAVAIEDKADPKESSLYHLQQRLRKPEEFGSIINLIKARAPSLKVFARLEGLNYGEPAAVTLRKAYLSSEAGADYLILHNTSATTSQLRQLVTACAGIAKIAIIPTTYMKELPTMTDLPISLLIFANQLLRARIRHSIMVSQALNTSPETVDECIASLELTNSLILR